MAISEMPVAERVRRSAMRARSVRPERRRIPVRARREHTEFVPPRCAPRSISRRPPRMAAATEIRGRRTRERQRFRRTLNTRPVRHYQRRLTRTLTAPREIAGKTRVRFSGSG